MQPKVTFLLLIHKGSNHSLKYSLMAIKILTAFKKKYFYVKPVVSTYCVVLYQYFLFYFILLYSYLNVNCLQLESIAHFLLSFICLR